MSNKKGSEELKRRNKKGSKEPKRRYETEPTVGEGPKRSFEKTLPV